MSLTLVVDEVAKGDWSNKSRGSAVGSGLNFAIVHDKILTATTLVTYDCCVTWNNGYELEDSSGSVRTRSLDFQVEKLGSKSSAE